VDGGSSAQDAANHADQAGAAQQQVPAERPAGPADPEQPGLPQRVWTVPNALSVARLAGVPVFLWLVLGPKANIWAVVLLVAAAASDWLDGKIARAWNQESRLGQMLDPTADRLYIGAMLIGLAVRGIIPWWLVGVLIGRELVLALALLWLRSAAGYGPLQVSLIGKTATLCLFYAFPLLLLGAYSGTAALVARVIGWAFVIWGTALYWWAAGLYLTQVQRLAVGREQAGPDHADPDHPDPGPGPDRAGPDPAASGPTGSGPS
jgi:cardiolipin synthase